MRFLIYISLFITMSITVLTNDDYKESVKKSVKEGIGGEISDKKDETKIENKKNKTEEIEKKEVKNQNKEKKDDLNIFEDSTKSEDEFELKLEALESEVNLLKERVFRSKARLSTLNETLVSGKSIQGAKLILTHKNKLSHFIVKSAIYHMDGASIYAKVDVEGDLSKRKTISLHDKIIIPGYHLISVSLKLEVKGFGLFSYAKGYQFQIKASHSFYVEEGKITSIDLIVYEKGGFFSDLTKKPDILFKAGVVKDLSQDETIKKRGTGSK